MTFEHPLPKASHALVIGCSAGGLQAMKRLLPNLPPTKHYAVLIAYHIGSGNDDLCHEQLQAVCPWQLALTQDKQTIEAGNIYFAPSNYHMLVEKDGRIALSVDEQVNYSRPAIDLLFKSAAECWGACLAAYVLTGANCDGTEGSRAVAAAGGRVYVQEPEEAEFSIMPLAVLKSGTGHFAGSIDALAEALEDPFLPNSKTCMRKVSHE